MEGTSPRASAAPDAATNLLVGERRSLINLAYRLVGTLSDAEDAAQEAYARWYALSPEQQRVIESPGGWLTTVVGRVCLDQLKSARVRRERYVGEWIPEPLPGGSDWINGRLGGELGATDPVDRVTLDESIHMAFMVMLETLTPAERVSFILHDVFRYSFGEIAEIVGRSPAACRQLATSARRRLEASKAAAEPAAESVNAVRDFKGAWQLQDIRGLIRLLDPNAASVADSGGHVPLAFETVEGAEAVAAVFTELMARTPGLSLHEREVNGQPGIEVCQDGVTVSVLAFGFAGAGIASIWAVRNPEKLSAWLAATD